MDLQTKKNRIALNCVEYNCTTISARKVEALMENSTVANKRVINSLVKEYLPDLYYDLGLNFYNPYTYYKTKRHLILVHSGIEYFISYSLRY